MEPTDKSPKIDELITSLTGKDRKAVVKSEAACMTCETPNLEFRDPLSRKEYSISGMCQNCQDSVFGKDEDFDGE